MQLVFDFYNFNRMELVDDRVRYLCTQKKCTKEINKWLKIELELFKEATK